ncbi:NAD(P)/FAD-dependent oxidoreductase [Massilia glaciei]|uniref:NAD(P)/FAD-dependent oxidoreductase n=1 Tax=Massilia glaciei TaxID=1524097 RepID=A0A2U2HE73_9BURK|nr:NAD(P)/FAD-dependent oxidoreductase [Massilia glaciei]PWF41575.1 NAD(P)/FAD-dependent oxidoreductase [Massilia glaciei]
MTEPTTPDATALSSLPPTVFDTLVIGAGPGGLSAAIYLRRFLRSVVVVDKGHSRLELIPVTRNYPGFADGIPGRALRARLLEQLAQYDARVIEGEITGLRREGEYFVADYEGGQVWAQTVLLATGIADAGLPIAQWREAVARGAVRMCPVCDGFDVIDRRVALATGQATPVAHALFMRTFTADVTLFERGADARLGAAELRALDLAGVRYIESPLKGVSMSAAMRPVLHTEDGRDHEFDVFYPMLGENARSELAGALGAQMADCAELVVDQYQCTTVPGLYAVGDVVRGLNQISVAAGQAAVASTHLHNMLPRRLRATQA